MKRSTIQRLSETVSVKVSDLDDLEVEIVPGKVGAELTAVHLNKHDSDTLRVLCEKAIVGFSNYVDDEGNPLPNKPEYRRELASLPAVQFAVYAKVHELHGEMFQGEASAASV